MKDTTIGITAALVLGAFALVAALKADEPPDYAGFQKQTVKIEFINAEGKPVGLCSGVYLGNDYVLTAGHCVQRMDQENVSARVSTFRNRETVEAHLVEYDFYFEAVEVKKGENVARLGSDLGLLRVTNSISKTANPAPLYCNTPALGESVYAVGMPNGIRWAVTKGEITTYVARRYREEGRWLQMDMTIIRGNSGGPVFNHRGYVVGIISHALSKLGGRVATNHSYAVSGPLICKFVKKHTEK